MKKKNQARLTDWAIWTQWQENKVNSLEWGSCPPLPLSDIFRPFGYSFPSDYLIRCPGCLPSQFTRWWFRIFNHSHTLFLLFCYRLYIHTPRVCACKFCPLSTNFSTLQKFLATSPTSEVKRGEWCQALTPGYCPGRCSLLSFKWSCFTHLSVLRAGRSLLPPS